MTQHITNGIKNPALSVKAKRFSDKMACSYHMIDLDEEGYVAPPDSMHPFAMSARQQQRERKLFKTATFNPWGNPIPDEDAPYLAITEDGYCITQDGWYELYKGPRKMSVASPRFKQLYNYHKCSPVHPSTPVTEKWLEARYGQFLLPCDTPRRKQLLTLHKLIKRGFEHMFSMATMEKKDGDKVKTKQSNRFGPLLAFYKTRKWQVDMAVTEECLEQTYGMLVPKDEFVLTDRYKTLLTLQEDVSLFEQRLERTYGILVPRSLPGCRLYHLI